MDQAHPDRSGPGDGRFFARTGPYPLARLAQEAGADARGAADRMFSGVAPLQAAGPDQVSFLDNRRYLPQLADTRAGAVIVSPAFADKVPSACAALITPQPYLAWARVAALFHPREAATPGIHPSAVVENGAAIDPAAEIGPFVHVGAGAQVGAGTRVGAGAAIGPGVVVGPDCRIGSHVSLSHAVLGARVTLFPGAQHGQAGFGIAVTSMTGTADAIFCRIEGSVLARSSSLNSLSGSI